MKPLAPLFDHDLSGFSKPEGQRSRRSPSWCLVLGIAAMFSWIVPPLGLLIAVAGLASAWRAGLYRNHAKARLGFILSAVAFGMNMLVCMGMLLFVFMSGSRD